MDRNEPTLLTKAARFVSGLFCGAALMFAVISAFLIMETTPFEEWWMAVDSDTESAEAEAGQLFESASNAVLETDSEDEVVRLTGAQDEGGAGLVRADIVGEHYVLADTVIQEDGRLVLVAVPRNGYYPVLEYRFTNTGDAETVVTMPAAVTSE